MGRKATMFPPEQKISRRAVVSRFEAAIALAGVEFGRFDLAIVMAEESQKQVAALLAAL